MLNNTALNNPAIGFIWHTSREFSSELVSVYDQVQPASKRMPK
jgi:hypothetical protein